MDGPHTFHLFVYGSLRLGCKNNWLLRMFGAKPVDVTAFTVPHTYALHNLGTYVGMVQDETGPAIAGEVWQVPSIALETLDNFEGVSTGVFTRQVVDLQGHQGVQAYLYTCAPLA